MGALQQRALRKERKGTGMSAHRTDGFPNAWLERLWQNELGRNLIFAGKISTDAEIQTTVST